MDKLKKWLMLDERHRVVIEFDGRWYVLLWIVDLMHKSKGVGRDQDLDVAISKAILSLLEP